ncbi:MAG: NAD(P)H-dependent oxidoreductase [Eubacterium sp.]|nr:NAD(P)H-dependent oxidoreductase [Eubacterium sp.]
MKKILFLNACVRHESRTKRLAEYLLGKLDGQIEEVNLEYERPAPLDLHALEERENLLESHVFDDKMFRYARQFAAADIIVIAAPYWDLSFPASLKNYIERINAIGITFDYNESGEPYGLCAAEKLYYITTAGGKILSDDYGFGYIRALCERFYEIPELHYYKAENLDLVGADVEGILQEAMQNIDNSF